MSAGNGMVSGSAAAWDRKTAQEQQLAERRDDETCRFERDGKDFFEAIIDAPCQWAFESDKALREHADRWSCFPGRRFEELKAERALGEAFIRALQAIWRDFNRGVSLTERDKALALYVESIIDPKIADAIGAERGSLVTQLAASLLLPKPARGEGEAQPVVKFLDAALAKLPPSDADHGDAQSERAGALRVEVVAPLAQAPEWSGPLADFMTANPGEFPGVSADSLSALLRAGHIFTFTFGGGAAPELTLRAAP